MEPNAKYTSTKRPYRITKIETITTKHHQVSKCGEGRLYARDKIARDRRVKLEFWEDGKEKIVRSGIY